MLFRAVRRGEPVLARGHLRLRLNARDGVMPEASR